MIATRGKRRGMTFVWFALVGIVLIAVVGLGSDTALVYLCGHQLQNAADAAALAGALKVRSTQAAVQAQAQLVASLNKAIGVSVQLASNPSNGASGDIVIGTYTRPSGPFTATLTSPNAVMVLARRTTGSPSGALSLIFGPLAGISTSNVSRNAIAMIGGTINAGLVVLSPNASGAISLNGNASINIAGNGAVVVNSTSSSAIQWTGNSSITASTLAVAGNDTALVGASVFNGNLELNAPPSPDPLIGMQAPPTGTTQSGKGPNINPGYYANGLPSGNLVLAPGVYYVDGGINLTGNNTMDASSGVTIYLNSGGFTMGGNTSFTINPPTSGPYAGISIFQARGNASADTFHGTPGSTSTGTFYIPSAAVALNGTPNSFASQLIANTVSISGNATLGINYNNNFPVQGHEVFLVQ